VLYVGMSRLNILSFNGWMSYMFTSMVYALHYYIVVSVTQLHPRMIDLNPNYSLPSFNTIETYCVTCVYK